MTVAGRRRGLVAVLVCLAATVVLASWWRLAPSAPSAVEQPAAAPAAPSDPEPTWGPSASELADAEELADGLSLEELAGQLIVARHRDNESSLELIRDMHFGGVLVTSPQIRDVGTDDPLADVIAFNEELARAGEQRGVPVMIPIDQEGGVVTRLKSPMTQFPSFMASGAAVAGGEAAVDAVSAAARGSGRELRTAGYNAVFAPGGDVTAGVQDPIIGSRSPGSDPDLAARTVEAAVAGYNSTGIISSVKHFPGHGSLTEDSHEGMPTQEKSLDELRATDYVPFEAAIEAGAPSIMTGHIEVPELDEGVPASMSAKVVTGELRERLGYEGLIVSDSLGMGAVIKRYPGGEAAVQTLKAGNDVALMPADNVKAYEAVLEALRSGDLPEAQARDSAMRLIALMLHDEASDEVDTAPGDHEDDSTELSAAAITIVTGPCDLDGVAAVNPVGSEVAVANFREAAQEAGLTLGSGPTIRFLGYGATGGSADMVVATDTPYALGQSQAASKIALFGSTPASMRALVAVLQGKAEAPGRLPVDVDRVERPGC